MLVEKRSKMRKQLRAEQLRARFALERKNLIQGKQSIFQQLAEKAGKMGAYEYCISVLLCAQRFPEDENSYLLIGNILIDEPQYCHYFENLLTAAPRMLEYYLWCLQILLFFYLGTHHHSEENEQQLRGIAQVSLQLGRELREATNRRFTWEEGAKVQRMQKFFVLIVKDLLDCAIKSEEMRESVKDTLIIMAKLEDAESEQLSQWLELLKKLKQRWEVVQGRLEGPFAAVFARIVLRCLKNLPQEREECVRMLQFLLVCVRDCHLLTQLPLRELLQELLYLEAELPALKPQILKLLQVMLEEARLNELALMLELRVHVILTRGMESAMRGCNNQQLEDCLGGLYRLLNKLSLHEERRLLERVKSDIEAEDFHLMVEGLLHNQQNQIIEGLVNTIVDDFYSQEVEEHL